MAKKNQIKNNFIWSSSIKKNGLEMVILWRTWFHNGISVQDLSMNTGLSEKTCQKHLDRLKTEMKIFWHTDFKIYRVNNPEKYSFEGLK